MFIFQEVEIAIQDVKQEEPIVNVKMEEDGSDDAEVEVVVKKPRISLMESLLYDDDDDVEITDSYRRTSREGRGRGQKISRTLLLSRSIINTHYLI